MLGAEKGCRDVCVHLLSRFNSPTVTVQWFLTRAARGRFVEGSTAQGQAGQERERPAPSSSWPRRQLGKSLCVTDVLLQMCMGEDLRGVCGSKEQVGGFMVL